jgi:YVTN family beta-propeller protein
MKYKTLLKLVPSLVLLLVLLISCTSEPMESSAKPILPTSTLLLVSTPRIATPLSLTGTPIPLPPNTVLAGKEEVAIKVDLFPQQLIVGEGAVWVPNAGSGTVSRIDPQTNKIVATIPIGKADPNNEVFVPSRVTIGDGYVWAAKNDDDSIVQIDPKINEVVATFPIGVEPFALAVDHGILWVSSRFENSIVKVDINTQQIVATISNVTDPTAIAVTKNAVWVVNHQDDAVTRIDPRTDKIVAVISLGTRSSNPNCGSCLSGITTGEGSVWIAVGVGGIVRIDPQTNQVIATIPTKGGTFGIVSNKQGIWFANWEDQAVLRIDPQTNQIVGAIPSSTQLAFLASGEGVLWATTDFSDSSARNKVIRFDIQP